MLGGRESSEDPLGVASVGVGAGHVPVGSVIVRGRADCGGTGSKSTIYGAVARAGDGAYLYLTAEGGKARLYLGTPDPDALDVALDGGTTLVGPDGVLQSGDAQPGTAMAVTNEDTLLLGWAQDGKTFLASCSLKGGAERAKLRQSYSARHELGPGAPTGAALNPRDGKPIFVGSSPVKEGTIWVARPEGASWTYEEIASGQGESRPRVGVSELGVVHVVWRDTDGSIWHLENAAGGPWLRSGGTSREPEAIGTAVADPALLCARHQVLVALPVEEGQIEYSLYTGQGWQKEPLAYGARPAVERRPFVGTTNGIGRPGRPVALLREHDGSTEIRLLHAMAGFWLGTRSVKAGGSFTPARSSSTIWRPSRDVACLRMSGPAATNSGFCWSIRACPGRCALTV